jgi:hypothetical protein
MDKKVAKVFLLLDYKSSTLREKQVIIITRSIANAKGRASRPPAPLESPYEGDNKYRLCREHINCGCPMKGEAETEGQPHTFKKYKSGGKKYV